jgi:hypothetical protein
MEPGREQILTVPQNSHPPQEGILSTSSYQATNTYGILTCRNPIDGFPSTRLALRTCCFVPCAASA